MKKLTFTAALLMIQYAMINDHLQAQPTIQWQNTIGGINITKLAHI